LPTTRDARRDEVTILIGGDEFGHWDELELHFAIDSYTTAGFAAPFEHRHKPFRETFRPFSYAPMEVAIGGNTELTGTMIGAVPRLEPDARRVNVLGYAKPGVLEDSDIPPSIMPFQANGLTLRQIAERLTAPFGITVKLETDDGAPFKRVKPKHDSKVQAYLVDLAQQRGVLISNTAAGELLLHKSATTGRPVARLVQGRAPVVSVVPTFNPQAYYSEITGFVPARKKKRGSKYTAQNPRLSHVLRCASFRLDDSEAGDAPAAVQAKLGRMFAGMVSYVVNVPTWRDPHGNLWKPNTTVELNAPDAMVYGDTELLIRDVFLRRSAEEKTASLGLVLPGAFSGEAPARMPWEE
jgi:prophage tail gpP-like protein